MGSITQKDGFTKSDKEKLREKATRGIIVKNICSKEYGFTFFTDQCLTDISDSLKKHSVIDMIIHQKEIRKVKINQQ